MIAQLRDTVFILNGMVIQPKRIRVILFRIEVFTKKSLVIMNNVDIVCVVFIELYDFAHEAKIWKSCEAITLTTAFLLVPNQNRNKMIPTYILGNVSHFEIHPQALHLSKGKLWMRKL